MVLATHIFERRWYENSYGDRETKAFVMPVDKYLARSNIWIYEVGNGEPPENLRQICFNFILSAIRCSTDL